MPAQTLHMPRALPFKMVKCLTFILSALVPRPTAGSRGQQWSLGRDIGASRQDQEGWEEVGGGTFGELRFQNPAYASMSHWASNRKYK